MTYSISKDFAFSASHVLNGLEPGHPCGRLHGHNYVVRLTLTGSSLNNHGFLLDYRDLAPVKDWIDSTLDHHHLNDVLPDGGLGNPTAERLATYIARLVSHLVPLPAGVLVSVSVSETPKTWATYSTPSHVI